MMSYDLTTDVDAIDFTGKTYLITGAANGIGRAVACRLSSQGAEVILLDRDEVNLHAVYDHICLDQNAKAVLVHQDLCHLTQAHCQELATQIKQTSGGLNGIIHCAAETGNLAPMDHYLDKDWSAVMSANLHAPYILTRTLRPLLHHSPQAAVIFTLSSQARVSTAFWGAYAATQQGLKALIESWADETEHARVKLLMLDPGKVCTDFLTRLYPGLDPNNHPVAERITPAYLLMLENCNVLHGKFLYIEDMQLKVYDKSP